MLFWYFKNSDLSFHYICVHIFSRKTFWSKSFFLSFFNEIIHSLITMSFISLPLLKKQKKKKHCCSFIYLFIQTTFSHSVYFLTLKTLAIHSPTSFLRKEKYRRCFVLINFLVQLCRVFLFLPQTLCRR